MVRVKVPTANKSTNVYSALHTITAELQQQKNPTVHFSISRLDRSFIDLCKNGYWQSEGSELIESDCNLVK